MASNNKETELPVLKHPNPIGIMEKCLLGNKIVPIPEELCTQEEIFNEVVSMETWDIVLNEAQRKRLIKFLPMFPEHDGEEKLETLRMLFSGENFKFGNPLQLFFKNLEGGCFAPDIAKMSALVKKASYRDYQHWQQRYYYRLLKEVLISRKKLLDAASVLPPDQPVKLEKFAPKPNHATVESRTKARYFYELQELREEVGELDTSSEDENYPGVPPKLSKKHKKRLQNLESSLSPEMMRIVSTINSHSGHKDAGCGHLLNPLLATVEITEDKYKEMLMKHQKLRASGEDEDRPDLDVTGITLDDIIARANISKRSAKPAETSVKKKLKNSESSDKKPKSLKPVQEEAATCEPVFASSATPIQPLLPPPQFVPVQTLLPPECTSSELSTSISQSVAVPPAPPAEIEASFDDVDIDVGSDPEGGHVALSGQEMKTDPENTVQHPHCFFSLLRNLFYEMSEQKLSTAKLEEQVRSWLENLAVTLDWVLTHDSWADLVPSALKFLAGDFIGLIGENFVPYLDYREKQQQWQWIGAGRDGDQQLASLCQQWIDIRDGISMDSLEASQNSPPPPRTPTEWTVRPTTDEEKSKYREQERVRYQNPHKAFTFHIHGYESVVGPVKGVYGKDSSLNKAREHSLLISDRPPFVTILSLVRDAAARLPNGEGTRADICELLKDSQYLSPACDSQINTVVSGALDRLHYEKDPCVKYDVNRKLWIYLHRHRTEEEFERIHQAQAAAAKAKKAIQKTKIPRTPKLKEPPRTSSVDEVYSSQSSEASSVGGVSSTQSTTASPRGGSSPRTQNSPKQGPQLAKSHSLPMHQPKTLPQITATVSAPSNLRKTTENTVATAPSSLSFTLLSQAQAVTSLTSTSESLTPLTPKLVCTTTPVTTPSSSISSQPSNGGNNSRPSSHGSVQSLPSPKTVIANVNAAQLLGVAHLQATSLPEQPSISLSTSGLTINTTTGIANIDMKPSSPAFVGQPPVLQPVLSHSSVLMSSTSPSTSPGISPATPPTKAANISGSASKRIHTSSILGQAVPAASSLQGFQTIVIKQEPGSKPSTTIATLPVLTTGTMGSTGKVPCTSSKPVVARLVSGTQVVSLGSLVAGSPLTAGKPGTPSAQSATIRIQSSGFVRPVGATASLNVLPTSQIATTASKFPRLAVVSQVSSATTSSIAASSAVASQPKLLAVSQAPLGVLQAASLESLGTQEGATLSLTGKPTGVTTQGSRKNTIGITASPTTVAATTIGGKPAVVVTSKASVVATGVPTATVTGANLPGVILASTSGATSQPTVVIATQGNLKPTQTYVMAAPGTAPTVVMATSTQPGVRGTTVTPLNMKALQGIKVIPVSQAVGGGKGGKTQPLLARIIAPPGGITLRPGSSVATVGIAPTQQMASPTAVSIIQGLSTVPVHSVEQAGQTTATVKQTALSLPSSSAQPVIVQVQTSAPTENPAATPSEGAKNVPR